MVRPRSGATRNSGALDTRARANAGPGKQLVFAGVFVLSLGIALEARRLLPSRNFNDDSTIRDFLAGRESSSGAYGSTAFLFKAIGLGGGSTTLVAFVAMGMFLVAIMLAIRPLRVADMSWPAVFVACAACGLAGLYLGMYSKEFFVIPLAVVFLVTTRLRSVVFADVLWLLAAGAYAYYVREYWWAVIGLYVGFRIGLRYELSVRRVLYYVLAAIGTLVLYFNVVLNAPAVVYRIETNAGLVTDRSTIIQDIFTSDSPILQLVNLCIIAVTLVFPVPLFLVGEPGHLISAVAVGAMWALLFYRAARHTRLESVGSSVQRALAWLVAYMLTQSLFEPDYSSYIRHLVPLMPLMLLVMSRTEEPG